MPVDSFDRGPRGRIRRVLSGQGESGAGSWNLAPNHRAIVWVMGQAVSKLGGQDDDGDDVDDVDAAYEHDTPGTTC